MPILEERYQRLIQHFQAAGVNAIESFVKGGLDSPQAEVALVHAAIGAMDNATGVFFNPADKARIDGVELERFVESLDAT